MNWLRSSGPRRGLRGMAASLEAVCVSATARSRGRDGGNGAMALTGAVELTALSVLVTLPTGEASPPFAAELTRGK